MSRIEFIKDDSILQEKMFHLISSFLKNIFNSWRNSDLSIKIYPKNRKNSIWRPYWSHQWPPAFLLVRYWKKSEVIILFEVYTHFRSPNLFRRSHSFHYIWRHQGHISKSWTIPCRAQWCGERSFQYLEFFLTSNECQFIGVFSHHQQ